MGWIDLRPFLARRGQIRPLRPRITLAPANPHRSPRRLPAVTRTERARSHNIWSAGPCLQGVSLYFSVCRTNSRPTSLSRRTPRSPQHNAALAWNQNPSKSVERARGPDRPGAAGRHAIRLV